MKNKKILPIVAHSLAYNPAIDGLRGVAVLLVLFFHLFPKTFAFGYVGVDVFFVLSGFLITKIIVNQLQNNRFSFKVFYRNRIRRIFPSLIIVLFFTSLIGYLFLFPDELMQLGKHISSSAFFYQNYQLIGETGYWDKVAQMKPLLHFWSLSIEEQFYLFFPLILFIIHKLSKHFESVVFALFAVLVLIPFVFKVDLFYNTFARAWELCFGGVIFIAIQKYNVIERYKRLKNQNAVLHVLIYVLLFALSLWFITARQYPGIKKLFPVVFSSGLLIMAVNIYPKNKIFANRLLVFFGLISYPLYLWHYVFISYAHILAFDVAKYGLLIALVSVIFSYLTYRFVEIFFRKQTSYTYSFVLLGMVALIFFMGRYISNSQGLPNRNYLPEENKYMKTQFIREPAKDSLGVSLFTKVLGKEPVNDYIKSTSDNVNSKFVAIVGDSHAQTSYPGFASELAKYGYETVLLSNSGCPPYPDGAMGVSLDDISQCETKIEDIYLVLENLPNLEKIIFTTRVPRYIYGVGYGVIDDGQIPPFSGNNPKQKEYFTDKQNWKPKEQFFNGIERLFAKYNNSNVELFYLIENPELGFSPKNCVKRPFNISNPIQKLPYSDYLKRAGEYRNFIYTLQQNYKGVHILDPKDLYCDGEYCYAFRYGKMLYADDDHHSVDGSYIQAQYFIDEIMQEK